MIMMSFWLIIYLLDGDKMAMGGFKGIMLKRPATKTMK